MDHNISMLESNTRDSYKSSICLEISKIQLNNSWIREEIIIQIIEYLELNKNENNIYMYGMQVEHYL